LPPVQILNRADETDDDIHHYESIALQLRAGEVPYRDFAFEYPPVALVPIAVSALATDAYKDTFRLVMLAIYATGIALVALIIARTGGGRTRLFASCVGLGLAPLALPTIFFNRLDAWPAVLLLAAMVAFISNRRSLAAGTLAVGTLAKVFPAAALPAVLLADPRRKRSAMARELAVFGTIVLLVLLPFVVVGRAGAEQAVSTLVRRPLHIESLGGSALLALHDLGLYDARVYVSFGGSQDLAGTLAAAVAAVQGAVTAAAVLLVWLLFTRGARSRERALTATAASVVALVAFGKVLSPQFLIWVVFVVPLVERRLFARAFVLVVAGLVLTRAYFPYRYEDLILLEGHVVWIAVLRNLVLVALVAYLVASLRRTDSRAVRGRRAEGRTGTPRASPEQHSAVRAATCTLSTA
jgi:Glycosyltransferase family 87